MTAKTAFEILANTRIIETAKYSDLSTEEVRQYDSIESQVEAFCRILVSMDTLPIQNEFLHMAEDNAGCEPFWDEHAGFGYMKSVSSKHDCTIQLTYYPYGNARDDEKLKASIQISTASERAIEVYLDGTSALDLEKESKDFTVHEVFQCLKYLAQWVAKIDPRYIEKAKNMTPEKEPVFVSRYQKNRQP